MTGSSPISDQSHEQVLCFLGSDVNHVKSRLSLVQNFFPIPESGLDLRFSQTSASIQQSGLVSQHLR